jgi:hypothetical protein
MNDNAKKLYEDLLNERLPQFDMTSVEDFCGAPLCIIGWAYHRGGFSGLDRRERAYEWLGLDWHTGQQLCFASSDLVWGELYRNQGMFAATQPEAAEALRRACESQ